MKTLNMQYFINNQISQQGNSNMVFSLTSIPTRFINPYFEKTISCLYNQKYKPKYIIINLCHKYKRQFIYDQNEFDQKIEYYKNKYENIIINFTEDLGPITKILGIKSLNNLLSNDDKIIVVDDDYLFRNSITYFYELIYQLYNCDCVFIDENQILSKDSTTTSSENLCNIFYNNYKNFVYGSSTFSIKYNFISQLYDFYNKVILEDISIINHDDLILTLFYKSNNLYACGINIFLQEYTTSERINWIDSLSNEEIKNPFRGNLEIKMCNIYNISYNKRELSNHHYNDNQINKNNLSKTLLYNLSNVTYLSDKNNFKKIDIKFFDINIIMITIIYFDITSIQSENNKVLYLQINNNNYKVELDTNCDSLKQTFLCKTR